MAKERCRVCGKRVRVQIQKNTGYCSAKCAGRRRVAE